MELCAEAIRGHWAIENKLHWHLDYNFNEDNNTTTDKFAFNNFSIMNKMVLTLFKLYQPLIGSKSISAIKRRFTIDFENSTSHMFNSIDNKTILDALSDAIKKK